MPHYAEEAEVDFYLPENGLAVQACWSMRDPDTRTRELKALEKLSERYELKKMFVVTRDESETIVLAGGGTVEVIPLAEWLLLMETYET